MQEEPFCQDESSCSAEFRSADEERFRGEPLSGETGHSQAHSPYQTHLVNEVPRDVVLSCAARFPGEEDCFLACFRSEESACHFLIERRDSLALRKLPRHGWPQRFRVP